MQKFITEVLLEREDFLDVLYDGSPIFYNTSTGKISKDDVIILAQTKDGDLTGMHVRMKVTWVSKLDDERLSKNNGLFTVKRI